MTLAEVIDTLQTWIRNADDEYDREEMGRVVGLKEALHEIKKIEPCEDCISRESLNNVIGSLTYWHFEDGRLITGGGGSKAETVYKADDVMRLTHVLPPVTPQPKTGRWIEDDSDDFLWKCSECGKRPGFTRYIKPNYNYCPSCGIRLINEVTE